MYKLKKDGLVRIVTTEAEAERWQGLGYQMVDPPIPEDSGQKVEDPLKSMEAEALKAFAAENGIDIGNATSQNGIYKKIRDALPWDPAQTGE